MEIRQARFQSSSLLYWKMNCIKQYLLAANGHRRKPKRENSSKQDVKWRHTHFLYWEKVMCTKRTTFHFECKWLNSRLLSAAAKWMICISILIEKSFTQLSPSLGRKAEKVILMTVSFSNHGKVTFSWILGGVLYVNLFMRLLFWPPFFK